MKKIVEYSLITILFIFSLIYTERASNIAKREDPIMKSIIKNASSYNIDSVNALVSGDTITPGIRGCVIDINKSYEKMKRINEYRDTLLRYKDLIPEITIDNIYNKYISNGNKKKRQVSIVVNISNDITEINSIASFNKEKINVFIDSVMLETKLLKVDKEYINIYNGGNNNNYDDITIEWMNDVILDNYNESKYCINKNKNDDNLVICARNKMHTISPKIIVKQNTYDVKALIENGSIIYFDENNIKNIDSIIKYVKSKGYEIVFLNELLNENMC